MKIETRTKQLKKEYQMNRNGRNGEHLELENGRELNSMPYEGKKI